MSLLDEQLENCTMLDKTTLDDGYGGVTTTWVEGASFDCAVTLDNSTQARVANQAGVKNLYTATTRKSVNLQFHDVFRRNSDLKVFRVTSDGDDKKTPMSAGLDMRQVSCEEWTIPSE
jgi:hypothetical protein